MINELRVKRAESSRKYYAKHKIQLLEKLTTKRHEDPEKYRIRAREQYTKHLEQNKARDKNYRQAHKDTIKNYMLNYTADPKNRIRMLCYNAARRAKSRQLEYSGKIEELLISNPPLYCACCGVILDYVRGKGNNPKAPSIDRVDSSKGYIPNNIEIICVRCNLVKTDGTIAEHELIVQYMKEHLCQPT
jgi:hypothetical protein